MFKSGLSLKDGRRRGSTGSTICISSMVIQKVDQRFEGRRSGCGSIKAGGPTFYCSFQGKRFFKGASQVSAWEREVGHSMTAGRIRRRVNEPFGRPASCEGKKKEVRSGFERRAK